MFYFKRLALKTIVGGMSLLDRRGGDLHLVGGAVAGVVQKHRADDHEAGEERLPVRLQATEERPFFKVDMIRTPMSVPTMEPEPPDMDVPPMTTAAMALSSSPLPLPG